MRLCQGFLELLLLVNCTALNTKWRQRGWRCSGRVTEYSNRYCGDQGPIEGCYFVDNFDQYRSCGELCNNIIAPSIDEEKCNAECPGFLARYCKLDSLHTSPLPTSTTSMDPSTTFTGSNGTTVDGTTNSEPSSNQLQTILLSVFITLGCVLLVVGIIIGVWCCYCKRRPARRENGSVDHSANTEAIALNGSPPTSRTPPLLSQEECPGTSSGPNQDLDNHLNYTTDIMSPPEDDKRLIRSQQANEDDT